MAAQDPGIDFPALFLTDKSSERGIATELIGVLPMAERNVGHLLERRAE